MLEICTGPIEFRLEEPQPEIGLCSDIKLVPKLIVSLLPTHKTNVLANWFIFMSGFLDIVKVHISLQNLQSKIDLVLLNEFLL